MAAVTIKDLARELGISTSTVSRALSGHPDISQPTREKVMAMAEKMQYRPNRFARSLQNKRSHTVGVIVPEIRHDFFSSAISGMEEIAYDAGYAIIVTRSADRLAREYINLQTLVSHHVDGIILSLSKETNNVDHIIRTQQHNTPIVLFDRVSDQMNCSKVVVNDYQGAYAATDFLAERGYRTIAHLAGPDHVSVSHERLAGYQQAIRDRGLKEHSQLVVTGGFHEQDGRIGIETLLSRSPRPDAVFAVNDPVAIGAYTRLRELAFRIPRDIALVGFSNNPNGALIDPPLTTVNQPAYEIGRTSMQLLIEQLAAEQPYTPRTVELATELVIRGSA